MTRLPHAALALIALALAAPGRAADASAGGDDAALATLAFALAMSPAAGKLPLEVDGPGANGAPAVELALEVSAREVVFAARPVVRVLAGVGARGATWRVERVNLPAQPQEGVAYRDVTVRVFLVATPDALESLLADARRAGRSVRITPALDGSPAGATGAAP